MLWSVFLDFRHKLRFIAVQNKSKKQKTKQNKTKTSNGKSTIRSHWISKSLTKYFIAKTDTNIVKQKVNSINNVETSQITIFLSLFTASIACNHSLVYGLTIQSHMNTWRWYIYVLGMKKGRNFVTTRPNWWWKSW